MYLDLGDLCLPETKSERCLSLRSLPSVRMLAAFISVLEGLGWVSAFS